MRVLVTGGSGFIGSNLVPLLEERGYEVENLDKAQGGDVASTHDAWELARGCDAIIHLAAEGGVVDSIRRPKPSFEANAWGTLNLLDAARSHGVEKFVLASTAGALLGEGGAATEDQVPYPSSPYGASKAAAEAYCQAFAGSYGVDTVILRFANVYGPGMAHKPNAVSRFFQAIREEEPIWIRGDGRAIRDFVYVADLCEGILAALEGPTEPGEVFHLGAGRPVSVGMLVAALKAAAAAPRHPVEYEEAVEGEIQCTYVDPAKAMRRLGWQAEIPLEEGLLQTWRALR